MIAVEVDAPINTVLAGDRSEWRTVAFGDVVRNVDDYERDPLAAGLERYVGLDHIDPESLHIRRWGSVADGTSFTRRFGAGQVLFGKRRAYQRKVTVAEWDGICSGDILVFEPMGGQLLPELLPFIVQSDGFFQHALGTSAGSLSPRTRWRDLAAYEFALPPKDEQQRIADILWAADTCNNHWETVDDALQVARESVLREMFGTDANTVSRSLGEGTAIVPFATVCSDGSQNGLYKSKSSYGTGTEMVHMGDLFGREIIRNGGMERVELTDEELSRFRLHQGDLLFARRSIVLEGAGKCSMVGELSEPVSFESSIIRTTLQQDRVYPPFMFLFFQSPAGRGALRSITRRGAVAGIAASDLLKIMVPVPSLQDQLRVAALFDVLAFASVERNRHDAANARLQDVLRESLLA